MPRVKVRRVDDARNSDMIVVCGLRDNPIGTTVHLDMFREGGLRKGDIYRRLNAGEELTLELTIVEDLK